MSRYVLIDHGEITETGDVPITLGAIRPGGEVDLTIGDFDATVASKLIGLFAVYTPGTPPADADAPWFFTNSKLIAAAQPGQLVPGTITLVVQSVPKGQRYWVQVIAEYDE